MLVIDSQQPRSRDVRCKSTPEQTEHNEARPSLRVDEDLAALVPHRPERAQLTHSVLHGTESRTISHVPHLRGGLDQHCARAGGRPAQRHPERARMELEFPAT
jgi:hypothetical protein